MTKQNIHIREKNAHWKETLINIKWEEAAGAQKNALGIGEKGESAAVVEYFVKDFLKMSFKTEQMSEKGLPLKAIISIFNFVLLD